MEKESKLNRNYKSLAIINAKITSSFLNLVLEFYVIHLTLIYQRFSNYFKHFNINHLHV